MRRRPIILILVVVLVTSGVWLAWHRNHRPTAQAPVQPVASGQVVGHSQIPSAATNAVAHPAGSLQERLERYRLSNTAESLNALLRRDSAVVLENARWDATRPLDLNIPAHLRAKGDAGTYIVKANGHIDDHFRELLRQAGLSMVAYVPHDAWLVRGTEAQIASVSGQNGVQAVMPFEPYYKLRSVLLPMAVDGEPVPPGTVLNVVLFADQWDATLKQLDHLGYILAEGPSPFGPVVTMQPRRDSLVALAQLPGVQIVELTGPRVPANDLARVRLGISVNTTTTNNYFGLSGTNVLVAMTDSGVDLTHPDLIDRVFTNTGLAGFDYEGHGTHVAAIIAGSGAASGTIPASNTPPGSVAGADYRGKAPGAKLYSMLLGDNPIVGLDFDSYVQQQAAATNALIWNNSWAEGGADDYDIVAASYDAAVRDALPFRQGSQPVLPVFAASGVSGSLRGYPGGGRSAGSINSPGTSKNGLTVGGLEQARNVTNEVVYGGSTNKPWVAQTDSSGQVAGFSGRGNVGIGVEGEFGRFKPDVVAPGTWVVSARSSQWDTNAYYNITNVSVRQLRGITLRPSSNYIDGVSLPLNAVGLRIYATATNLPVPLPIEIREGDFPPPADFTRTNYISLPPDLPVNAGSDYFYNVLNPTNVTVQFNLRVEIYTTNGLADYYDVLHGLNDGLGGAYRYENGTSMAAPGVSGMLALMQEFYEGRLARTNSPALMKALLINGARSASPAYDLVVRNNQNDQGWGLPNLPTSLPPTTNALATNATSFIFFDQSPTNALATGQSQTRSLVLANPGIGQPLRVTLVWTDPPGNPAVGVKLVNDLDLVVTNLDTGEVFYGNDIQNGDFTSATDTNSVPQIDVVNNVENVYLSPPLSTNYTITVIGHRVNVNAVTAQTNGIAQDYALVISSGNGEVTNAFAVSESPVISADTRNVTTVVGAAVGENANDPVVSLLSGEHVGANNPLIVSTNGTTNQWHFYVVTNTTTFSNAAFAVFTSPNLSVPRMGVRANDPDNESTRPEADIDLYVSTQASLTNLDPAALLTADRSVGRGGTEFVLYTNSTQGVVYYVGVKSEDQMAAEYGFFSAFSPDPFMDNNGTLRGFAANIPDGSPENPKGAYIVMFISDLKARRVVLTNSITHENFGDLLGDLSHNGVHVVLNNHTYGDNTAVQTMIYEDNGEPDIVGSRHTDGPGSLQDFMGRSASGVWLLAMIDNAPTQTGRVLAVSGKIEKQDLLNGDIISIAPNSWGYDAIEVPVGATNLSIGLSGNTAPVELYVRRGDIPDFDNYDKKVTVPPNAYPSLLSTNALSITKFDLPPLQPGIYYIGVYNPNAVVQIITLRAHIDIDLTGIVPTEYSSLFPVPILDDAVTNSTIDVTSTQRVARVEVGVAIRHPRVSDLALQLISPAGKRVLLFENRGGLDTNGLGSVTITTNVLPAVTSGDATANTNIIAVGSNHGTLVVNHTFFSIPDDMRVYYDGALIYDTGLIPSTNVTFGVNFGPGVSSNLVIIMNEGNNADTNTTWEYTASVIQRLGNYVYFTEDTNKNPQLLKFAPVPFRSGPTNVVVWSDGFESSALSLTLPAGTYFAGGWHVDSGTVDYYRTGVYGVGAPNPDSGLDCLEVNGTSAGVASTNIATVPGVLYTLSFSFSGNPDGGPPQATVLINGSPIRTVNPGVSPSWSALNWQRTSLTFTATGTNTLLSLRGDTAGAYGVLFDTLVLTREQQIFYYPEETLDSLKSDIAKGTWTLEVWDSRAGATNAIAEISSWNLLFLFGDTEALPVNVQTGQPVTNTIPPGQFQILAIDVPPWATVATNSLLFADRPLLAWFNQNIVPTGINPSDVLFYGGSVTNGVKILTTNSAPVLLPGHRYYIGLQNTNTTAATYAFRVDFDITALTNAIPYTAVTSSNGIPRYFTYTLSSNATGVTFDLYGMDGNLNLVARQGAPPPTIQAGGYDYGSFNFGLVDEQIIVLSNSSPVALQAGTTWYLGVYNTTANPVNYSIRATEYTNAIPAIITLTNALPYTVTSNNAAPGSVENYRYVVTPTAARVQFETFGADGDFTLVARKGLPLPDLGTYDYLSVNAATNDELIVVFTNSVPVALTPGEWFITAVKVSAGAASYNIMATEWTVTGQPITITNIDTSTGDFCITWNSLPGVRYIVQSTPSLTPIAWGDASPILTANDFTTTWCTPIIGTMQYFHVIEAARSTLPGSTPPPAPILPPTITSVNAAPGSVTLTWSGPTSGSYHVEWTGALAPPPVTWTQVTNPITSTNGTFIFVDDGSQTAPLGPQRFYRLVAP